MPELHAKLSPSSAERWMTCPGSQVLSDDMPQKTSAYADEGTAAHALAEAMLNTAAVQCPNPEMLAAVQIYVDHVRELNAIGTKLHVETVVKVSEQCWGTADAIVWDPTTATLFVRDLKYGAGVPVVARGNLQLKIYALAALLTMKYPAKVINVGIVQPRIVHEDGCIRSVDYDSIDLLDFHADLADASLRVKEAYRDAAHDGKVYGYSTRAWQEKYLVPSEKGCRWCLAAPTCPKLKVKAQELAKQVFQADAPYDPKALAETLDFLPILEGWIKNTREFAYSEAEQGRTPPSYKLVEKRATRKWIPFPNTFLLTGLLNCKLEDITKPAELKPVGDILKMCPGKNDAERGAALEPFTIKESSGHSLVHESDKREPVRLDAKAAFAPETK